jgi:Domain of unknown function (DUF3127)
MAFENKNDKQLYFNQVKGSIKEICIDEKFCNVVILAGHENPRDVSFVCKTYEYKERFSHLKIGDKVSIKFYLTSRFKNGRWYTNANALDITED